MIITFWSPLKGKGCVTSTTILTALIAYKKTERDLNLITTMCKDSDMSFYFEQRLDFTETIGMEGVEQLLNSNKLDTDKFMAETTTLAKNRLDILPWKKTTNENLVVQEIYPYLNAMAKYSNVFIDIGSLDLSPLTLNVIKRSDVVIVCIPQESKDLTVVKDKIKTFVAEGKRVLGLVTPFDSDCKLTLKTIMNSVGLAKDDIFFIPYLHEIKDDFESQDASKILHRLDLSAQKKFVVKSIDKLFEQLNKLLNRVYSGGGL